MLKNGTRILAAGLALMLSSSTANAVWTLSNVSSSYLSGADIFCTGSSDTGTAAVQQHYNLSYNPNGFTAFGPAPAIDIAGSAWSKTLTASAIANAINCRVKLTPSSGGGKFSNTYTVF